MTTENPTTSATSGYKHTPDDLEAIRQRLKLPKVASMSYREQWALVKKLASEQLKTAQNREREARETEAREFIETRINGGENEALALLDSIHAASLPTFAPLDLATEPLARSWLIDDWLPAGRAGLLAGRGEAGKTRLALQLAAGIASGMPSWLPGGPCLEIGNGRTLTGAALALIATWEDERDELIRRVRSWQKDQAENIQKRLQAAVLNEIGPIWEAPRQAAHGCFTEAGKALLNQAIDIGARLLIVDAAAGAFGGAENDRAHVRQFMGGLDGWAQRAECAVLVIAHPAKVGKDSDPDAWPASGSGDWINASRFVWALGKPEKHDTDAWQLLTLYKANYSQKSRKDRGALRLKGYPWRVIENQPGRDYKSAAAGDDPVPLNV